MTNSKSSFPIWAIILLALLLLLSGYLWYKNSQVNAQLEKLQTEMYEIEKVQSELDKDYQDALESIESLRDESKDLNALIDSQKTELEERKKKIDRLIRKERELGQAREEMAALKTVTDGYITEINTLKAENAKLTNRNRTLTTVNEALTVNLEEKTILSQELGQAKEVLTVQNTELNTSNEKLSATVDVASVVKINWMQVKGYSLNDEGKLKYQKKAKKTNVLRICYKTETNVVAAAGSETFQVRYVDPTGETLAVESLGSGVLMDNYTNKQVRYSKEGNMDYNNTETESCMDWQVNFPLIKGEYDVYMYNKGFECGKGTFKLK